MAELECFFDCSSPWTYLAFHNLPAVAQEFGIEIAWRPILVGGVFNAINPSVQAARDHPVPAKLAYMKKDLQDWAREAELRILFPPTVFPVNSVKAMRGCLKLAPEGKLVAFARAVFAAYWSEDKDISRVEVLTEVCRQVGVDPDYLLAGIEAPAIKDQLRANTQELIDRGGFGSPHHLCRRRRHVFRQRPPGAGARRAATPARVGVTMPANLVLTAIDQCGVAHVIVNNPERRNAAGNDGKRALVFTGCHIDAREAAAGGHKASGGKALPRP